MKNRVTKFIFCFVFAFASCLSFYLSKESSKLIPETPKLAEAESVISSYTVLPVNFDPSFGVEAIVYPTIRTSPSSGLPYFLAQRSEVKDIATGTNDQLFFANKRIAEMEKWGAGLALVKIDTGSEEQLPETVTQILANWWVGKQPKSYEFWNAGVYSSWEAELARYFSLVNESIDQYKSIYPDWQSPNLYRGTVADLNALVRLAGSIKQHQQKLDSAIAALLLPKEDKHYLTNLTTSIFTNLATKVSAKLPPFSPGKLLYPLTDIQIEKDYGVYRWQTSEVSIDSKVGFFAVNTPTLNLLTNDAWAEQRTRTIEESLIGGRIQNRRVVEERGNAIYTQDIASIAGGNKLLLTYQPVASVSATIQVWQDKDLLYTSPITDLTTDFTQATLLLKETETATPTARLVLLSDKTVDPGKFAISLYQASDPEIILEKTASLSDLRPALNFQQTGFQTYILTLQNVGQTVKGSLLASFGFGWRGKPIPFIGSDADVFEISYWPRSYLLFGSVMSFLGFILFLGEIVSLWQIANLTGFGKRLLVLLLRSIWVPIRWLALSVARYCRLFRFPFLGLVFFGIIWDIFVFKKTSDSVITFLTLTWVSAIIGWRFEGRFSFGLALVSLVLCPFLLILKLEPIAEKAAIWAYLFLVVGTIQSLIENGKERKLTDFNLVLTAFSVGFKEAKKDLSGDPAEISENLGKRAAKISSYISKLFTDFYHKSLSKARNPQAPIWVKVTFKTLAAVTNFIIRFWLSILVFLLLFAIFQKILGEVIFYQSFFEINYFGEFSRRVGIIIFPLWLIIISLGGVLVALRPQRKKTVLLITLVVFLEISSIIFGKTRSSFNNLPYIIRLKPDIASTWTEVTILGRNFNNMPFRGKVILNGKEQRVIDWTDEKVTFETDIYDTSTGTVTVLNDYENKKVTSNGKPFIFYNSATATAEEQNRFWQSLMDEAKNSN